MHTCCGEKKEKGNRAPCLFSRKFHLTWRVEKCFFFRNWLWTSSEKISEIFFPFLLEKQSQVKMEQNKALKFTSQKQKKTEAKFSGRKKVREQVRKGSKEIPRLFPPPPPSGECGRFPFSFLNGILCSLALGKAGDTEKQARKSCSAYIVPKAYDFLGRRNVSRNHFEWFFWRGGLAWLRSIELLTSKYFCIPHVCGNCFSPLLFLVVGLYCRSHAHEDTHPAQRPVPIVVSLRRSSPILPPRHHLFSPPPPFL